MSHDDKVTIAPPKEHMAFDGERVTPWVRAPIWTEHVHRYLSVLPEIAGKRVLDIACGEGYGAALMWRNGAPTEVVGADVDATMVTRAQRIYGQKGLSFQHASVVEPLPFDTDAFDVITCFETIEHVVAQETAIDNLKRVLAPGGLLVISTPDRLHPHSQGTENPFHEKELDETEFRALLSRHFPHIRASYQQTVTGSAIVDEHQALAHRVWEREGFGTYHAADRLRAPLYMILRASDQPLPPAPSSLLQDPVLQSLINQTLKRDGMDFPPPEQKGTA